MKKYLLLFIFSFLLAANFCYAATSTLINITPEDISEMLGWTTAIIDQLKPFWLLIVGILLGVAVLGIIIRHFSKE